MKSRFSWLLALTISSSLDASPILNGSNPLVDPSLFRVTTFATGLSYPTSMTRLPDGSIVVGTTLPNGSAPLNNSFDMFTGIGQLIRLTDTDHDGVADGPGTVVAGGIAGNITSVRTFGDIVAIATLGNGADIYSAAATVMFFRQGALPADPYTSLGSINFTYPSGVILPPLALAVRDTPGQPGNFDLFVSFPGTSHEGDATGTIAANGLFNGSVAPGSIWQTTVTPGAFAVTTLAQVASGVRTSAGLAFDTDGTLLITDNGFQSYATGLEVSADELHRIDAASLASSTFLGYPANYPDYNTGAFVGGAGQQAFVAFTPMPGVGESRGAAEITKAPANFPAGLNSGYFVGFHGLWDEVGTANTINPVYYIDPVTGEYSAFITAGQSGISKPDGLLASPEGLYIADLFTVREFGPSSGNIYLISLNDEPASTVPEPSTWLLGAIGLGLLARYRRVS